MDKKKFYDKIINEDLEGREGVSLLLSMQKKAIKLIGEYNLQEFGTDTPDWESMTFRERSRKGYLLPYLKAYDAIFTGRHEWWDNILEKKEPFSSEIPQLVFGNRGAEETYEMISECIRYPLYTPRERLRLLLVYIGRGLGFEDLETEFTSIPEELIEHFYRNLDMIYFMRTVFDHLRFYNEVRDQIDFVEKQRKGGPVNIMRSDYSGLEKKQKFEFRLSNEVDSYNNRFDISCPPAARNSTPYILGMSNHTIGINMEIFHFGNSTEDLIKRIALTLYAPHFVFRTPEIDEEIREYLKEKEKETRL